MADVGLTHIALPVKDVDASIRFYEKYAAMTVVHRRSDPSTARSVVWLSDRTRPFVIVLIEAETVEPILLPWAHLGVGCASREDVDRLVEEARADRCLVSEPRDDGHPVGYWAFLKDPDGHSLELSYGQDVGLAVAESA